VDPSTLASAYRAMPDFTSRNGVAERVWRRLPAVLIGYSSVEPRGLSGLTAGARGDGAFEHPSALVRSGHVDGRA
jgi:hypothetical protein